MTVRSRGTSGGDSAATCHQARVATVEATLVSALTTVESALIGDVLVAAAVERCGVRDLVDTDAGLTEATPTLVGGLEAALVVEALLTPRRTAGDREGLTVTHAPVVGEGAARRLERVEAQAVGADRAGRVGRTGQARAVGQGQVLGQRGVRTHRPSTILNGVFSILP